MRIRFLCCLMAVCVASVSAEAKIVEISKETVSAAIDKADKSHPRLFINDKQLADLKQRIEKDVELEKYNKALLYRANIYLGKEPCERKLTGRRLLGVSREVLGRVLFLSWAYRMTGDGKYKDRCVAEMLAAGEFSDWNPSHFLDVGEMTAALAIGYDWLYNDLTEDERAKIRGAIVEKGLEESREKDGKKHWWVTTANNWNQVCHGGLTCGALAVMEDEQELSNFIIHRAVNNVQVAMAEYEPDGAYPEGPGYWSYGTSYNVIMIAALDSALGNSFALGEHDSFLKSAEYYLFATGPTGLYYNYADCGSRGSFNPAVYWFARKTGDASVAWWQDKLWEKYINSKPSELVQERTAVFGLLWKTGKQVVPDRLSYVGKGRNPVAMFRSGWDDDAIYVGIKGGSPGSNHAHMDVGSFVIDAMGERWAWDLGPENYNKIEQLGMNLWDRSQGSDRWKIYRYNNTSHNTLVVNGKHQRVGGFGEIIQNFDNKEDKLKTVAIDMSSAYAGELKSAIRTVMLNEKEKAMVSVIDLLEAGDKPARVKWQMATKAEVEIRTLADNNNMAILKQNGKELQILAAGEKAINFEIYSAAPQEKWDAKNDGMKFIGFDLELDAKEKVNMIVMLMPEKK